MKAQDRQAAVRMGAAGLAAAVIAAMAVALCSLAGCNTTEGVGKDLESAGEGIKDAARDAKD